MRTSTMCTVQQTLINNPEIWVILYGRHGKINKYNTLAERPKWTRQLGRARCRWKNYITMDFKEVVCDNVDWIHRAQDKLPRQALLNKIIKYLYSIHPEHYTLLI
jgi:hypothetical protein